MPISKTWLADAEEKIKEFPDNAFDLAIIDAPYRDPKGNRPTKDMREKMGDMKKWKGKPSPDYFEHLFRVSKNQIIWGANNFIENLWNTDCMIWWNKKNPMDNYSDGELAWTSFKRPSICIELPYYGKINQDKDGKFHPNQKPIVLYKHVLQKFAKTGDVILDTHLGSGSHRIACYEYGFDFYGIEYIEQYYNEQEERFKNYIEQLDAFKEKTVIPSLFE